MSIQTLQAAHESLVDAGLPGCWRLDPGRALTLRPARAGVLRVSHGRLWITLDMLREDVQAAGDLFLVPGRGIVVQAGQRVVLEPAGSDRQAAAYFSWDPLARGQAIRLDHARRAAGRWHLGVVQPVRDLGLALQQAGAALGRLAGGVARWALSPVTRRQASL